MEKRLAVVLIGLLAGTGTAFADGGMFLRRAAPRYADVYQPTQKVYIRWDGSEEKLLIQTKYEGPAEEMVWIIPTPSQPTVQRADGSIFNDLSKLTYDLAIDFTDFVGLKVTTFAAGGGASSDPVEWHERIGDYDVALLRPVDGEDVIQWLNANDFAIPESINPILESYLQDGWWMMAARIHPDALSSITSERLAKGTLHPLELTFRSSTCVFPMRLTSMAAGPVEELIYIEGPAHYEPAMLTDAPWDVRLFGGPIRKVEDARYLSDLERAVEIAEGRTQTTVGLCLTKLRRVFQPSEMTEDLVFREIDLAEWLASTEPVPLTPSAALLDRRPDPNTEMSFTLQLAGSAPMRIGQAATQYGRWRDPNGIASLVNALSGAALDAMTPEANDYLAWPSPSGMFLSWWGIGKWSWAVTKLDWPQHPGCGHLRSCIWALGEIGVEHDLGAAAEDKLLECAQHDNQLIRMEACLALTKSRSEKLGRILADKLACVLHADPLPTLWPFDFHATEAEMDIIADWIIRFGTLQQRDAFVDLLGNLIGDLDGSPLHLGGPPAYDWSGWLVWRAASMQDEHLVPALEGLRSRVSPDRAIYEDPYLVRAEAACGSSEATAAVIQQLLEDESRVLSEGQIPDTGSFTSLGSVYYDRKSHYSLRVQILGMRGMTYMLFPMPVQASDLLIRSVLSNQAISGWYALYLLAEIRRPQASDRDRVMQVWSDGNEERRLLAVDVLYVWGDAQMLMHLYAQAESAEVRSEIAWALATLKVPAATSIIAEQVRNSWNLDWLALGRTFIHPVTDSRTGRPIMAEYLNAEMRRVEEALWSYFHPTSGLLDAERLAVLKRLAADDTIHAGMRFDLLGTDYGGTEWGLPLQEEAARDILAVDSSSATIQQITSMMKALGNSGFVIDTPVN